MIRQMILVLAMATAVAGIGAAQSPPSHSSAPLVERPRLEPSTETVLVSFAETVSLRKVFQEIGQQSGITILFDEAYRDRRVQLDLGSVSVEDALDQLTMINRLFYKVLDPRTLIIIPDNAQKHRQYDDVVLHTFYLEHGDINIIANMFRTIVGIQRVEPDPAQSSVTVRATADQILVAQSVLERNDFPPKEVSLTVEVLAVESQPEVMGGAAWTSEDLMRVKNDQAAELVVSQTFRVTANRRATISLEGGELLPIADQAVVVQLGGERVAPARSERALGLQLSVEPQVSLAGDIQLSLTLRATTPATPGEDEPQSVRSREVATTVMMKPGEFVLLTPMFRVNDFGSALQSETAPDDSRPVVLAIGAALVRAPEGQNAPPPLHMGTEQRILVRQP